MSKLVDQLQYLDILALLNRNDSVIARFQQISEINAELTSIIEGSGAPTFAAPKHSQYFDTATSKYYRNTDGGTTWVALN